MQALKVDYMGGHLPNTPPQCRPCIKSNIHLPLYHIAHMNHAANTQAYMLLRAWILDIAAALILQHAQKAKPSKE